MGRASMVLTEPPLNPHIETALKASSDRREAELAAALAIEPVISPVTEKLLLESMAWQTGAILPSTRAWKVEEKRKAAAERETAATAEEEAADAVGEIRAAAARRASMGSVSAASTGGEWWSVASSDAGDETVSGARGGSAPVGPIAWWPKTTVFKRRDSLVQLINDKTISAEERKARRHTRSREREKNEVPRERPLHVKHYGKMCLLRSDQKLSFRDAETFPVVDTYHHPLRDRSLSELREREPGLRPENMDHNATLIIRERGISTANPEEARRTPKHAALYHSMAVLPDLPTEARPVTVPSSLADLSNGAGADGVAQPSLSLAYMRERTNLASRGASEHDLRQRDNLRKLDARMEAVSQQKATVAARHSYQDVERHVHRRVTEPTGTTADGRPVSSGPGYAIGSDRMPVHTGVVPQRWTVGRGKEQRLMEPSMWDEAREQAEASRGSDRSASRQSSWKRLDTPDVDQQRQWQMPGLEMPGDVSAIGVEGEFPAEPLPEPAPAPTQKPEPEGTAAPKEPEPQAAPEPEPEAALDTAPEPEQEPESAPDAAPEPEQEPESALEPVLEPEPEAAPEPVAESDFSVEALDAEFSGSITPRASTPASVGQWEESRPRISVSSRRSPPPTRDPDPQSSPHVGAVSGSRAPSGPIPVQKAPKPAEARAATLDPRCNRAISAAAAAARRKGVWALSKQLRGGGGEEGAGGASSNSGSQLASRETSSRLSSRSAEFQKGSRWSTLVADELSAPDVGALPLALPGAFQGDPAARWWGSNKVLRNSRSRENMASLSAVGVTKEASDVALWCP
jgi:hypothetical protein